MPTSPWLDIPLDDYEAHMALAHVGQAQLLSAILGAALDEHAPRSIAVLGCAGGNGLEQAAARGVTRIVCIDLNPDYVARTRARWSDRLNGLELFVGDVQRDTFGCAPVDLVFAALLFEYVDVDATLANVRGMLRADGTLATVTQLPSAATSKITPSPYTSLAALGPIMTLVTPERLAASAARHGYERIDARTVNAPSSKRLSVQTFKLRGPTGS